MLLIGAEVCTTAGNDLVASKINRESKVSEPRRELAEPCKGFSLPPPSFSGDSQEIPTHQPSHSPQPLPHTPSSADPVMSGVFYSWSPHLGPPHSSLLPRASSASWNVRAYSHIVLLSTVIQTSCVCIYMCVYVCAYTQDIDEFPLG